MSKSIKLKDNNYIDSSSIVHGNSHQLLSTLLGAYIPSKNRNAWSGTVNKLTLPNINYGYYLIISMTPYGDFSFYLLFVNGTSLKSYKVAGNKDTSFSINGNILNVTLSDTGYWNSFALYLGGA